MKVLKDILEQPKAFIYNEAVGECRRYCVQQLQRLALRGADQLMVVFLIYYDGLLTDGKE